uniref:Uncharacterized protein n=1 Tax=Ditylenchus dipsaci TaxID=166011 RepID=A0A915DRK8_9BILA
MEIQKYDVLRACQTVQFNLTNECFDIDSVVEYLHKGKLENQTMKLFVTNEAAMKLVDLLKQRFLHRTHAVSTSFSYTA